MSSYPRLPLTGSEWDLLVSFLRPWSLASHDANLRPLWSAPRRRPLFRGLDGSVLRSGSVGVNELQQTGALQRVHAYSVL